VIDVGDDRDVTEIFTHCHGAEGSDGGTEASRNELSAPIATV